MKAGFRGLFAFPIEPDDPLGAKRRVRMDEHMETVCPLTEDKIRAAPDNLSLIHI